MRPQCALILAVARAVDALYADQAGEIDWQRDLLGYPVTVEPLVSTSSAAILYLSDKGQLARIDDEGRIVWRRDCKSSILSCSPNSQYALTISDEILRIWDTKLGTLEFSAPAEDAVWTGDEGVIVYSQGYNVNLFSVANRTSQWKQTLAAVPHSLNVQGSQIHVGPGRPCLEVGTGSEQTCYSEKINLAPSSLRNLSLTAEEYPKLEVRPDGTVSYMNHDGDALWTRQEDLAYLSDAVILHSTNSSSESALSHEVSAMSAESYTARLVRHVRHWNTRWFGSVLSTIYHTLLGGKSHGTVHWHLLGFESTLLVVRSEMTGRIHAVDIRTGKLQWSNDDYAHRSDVHLTTVQNQLQVVTKTKTEVCLDVNANVVECYSENPNEFHFKVSENQHTIIGDGWTLDPGSEYKLLRTAERDNRDVTSSVGEVTPLKQVRYKYINPKIFAAAYYRAETKELLLVLADGATGRVLHALSVSVTLSRPSQVQLIMGEHWLLYTTPNENQLATNIGVVEYFESMVPNERMSDAAQRPAVYEETFVFPQQVGAIGLTRSRNGIVSRNILIATSSGQVWSLPKQALRPRSLLPDNVEFNPVLSLPQEFGMLSHNLQVKSLSRFEVEPSSLESTLVVCASGDLDIYCTLVTPSGEIDVLAPNFGRMQLVLFTVVLFFVKNFLQKLANSKTVKMQWR